MLYLIGEVDLNHSRELKSTFLKIIEREAAKVIVDLDAATYIDSAGVGSLLFMFSESKKRGIGLKITGVHGPVLKVIELTKLDGYFPLVATVDEAIREIG